MSLSAFSQLGGLSYSVLLQHFNPQELPSLALNPSATLYFGCTLTLWLLSVVVPLLALCSCEWFVLLSFCSAVVCSAVVCMWPVDLLTLTFYFRCSRVPLCLLAARRAFVRGFTPTFQSARTPVSGAEPFSNALFRVHPNASTIERRCAVARSVFVWAVCSAVVLFCCRVFCCRVRAICWSVDPNFLFSLFPCPSLPPRSSVGSTTRFYPTILKRKRPSLALNSSVTLYIGLTLTFCFRCSRVPLCLRVTRAPPNPNPEINLATFSNTISNSSNARTPVSNGWISLTFYFRCSFSQLGGLYYAGSHGFDILGPNGHNYKVRPRIIFVFIYYIYEYNIFISYLYEKCTCKRFI